MKLYLLTRIGSQAGYDEYDNAVVMAASPIKARRIHPDSDKEPVTHARSGWPAFEHVRATYIGDAQPKMADLGFLLPVICSSFRAG